MKDWMVNVIFCVVAFYFVIKTSIYIDERIQHQRLQIQETALSIEVLKLELNVSGDEK